jgi:trehalose/maltose transport system substrate-binding protein
MTFSRFSILRFLCQIVAGGCLLAALLACKANPSATSTRPVTPTAVPITLTFIGNPNGVSYDLDKQVVDQFVAETGIRVNFIAGPESATERISQYLELLEAGSSEIDVYQIDVIWPGMLGEHMLDLNSGLADEASQHFPAIVANNTVDGRLIAIPFFTDVGLLYYRTDLLEKYGYTQPPETWAELEEMAFTIQSGERAEGNPDFWGYVWQGAAYEGLTCNALEWQASAGGGQIIEVGGLISVNNPQAAAAFTQAAAWIGHISPPGITGHQEEDSRSIWQAGNAAFMRNWPYAYAKGQAADSLIQDKFAVTLLPTGGVRHADTLGGWQLAVSRYSQNPEEAIRFVQYMTSSEVQLQRSIAGAFLPTLPALYDHPEALAANPYYQDLKEVFLGGAVARPSNITGERYNDVSVAYFTAVHTILTQQQEAAQALAALEQELIRITGFQTAQP